jgi:hypothetical protein
MTKASIGDGTNVNSLVYEVWKTTDSNERDLVDDGTTAVRLYQKTIDFPLIGDRRKVNVTLNLVKNQNYTVLFWPQSSSCSAYNTDNLSNIMIDYSVNASFAELDKRDVFHGVISFTASRQNTNLQVTLARPFALLAVGNSHYDTTVANQSSTIEINSVATLFNAITSTASGSAVESFSFNIDGTAFPNKSGYTMVGAAYLLPIKNSTISATITTAATTTKSTTVTLDPLEPNNRYNILGSDLIAY